MLPLASKAAVVAFTGCVVSLVLALFGRSPLAATLAGGLALGLAGVLALSTSAAARLRRERLSFQWALAQAGGASGGAIVVGSTFEIRCSLRNHTDRRILLDLVTPVAPDTVAPAMPDAAAIVIEPRGRTEFAFRFGAKACGRVVLQGVAAAAPGPLGLFAAPLYFPSPIAFDVLPRAAARHVATPPAARGLAGEPAGPVPLRRPGGGNELREIREHQSGDPFNSIAWKASARAGRLMVREVEREVQEAHVVVLDASGTMRGDAPGARKLDRAIEIAALAARLALERGDRAGLVTVDGRVLAHVPPREGPRQALSIYRALIATTGVVDADLTDVEGDELVALVGRHLRHQEGIELRREGAWDAEGVDAHARRLLSPGAEGEPIVAATPRERRLRALCRERGIPLPYRAQTRDFAKSAGLATALREAAGRSRSPRTLLVLTDLEDVPRVEALDATLAMLRQRGHALAFLCLREAREPAPESEPLAAALHRVYALGEARRLHEARRALARHGIPVVACEPGDAEALVLRRARAALARGTLRVA